MSYGLQMLTGFCSTLLGFLVIVGCVVIVNRMHRPAPALPVGIDRMMRETVIVTLKTGEAWQGVLFEDDSRTIVLRNAFGLGMADRGENLPVDGELILFVVDIAYAQKP